LEYVNLQFDIGMWVGQQPVKFPLVYDKYFKFILEEVWIWLQTDKPTESYNYASLQIFKNSELIIPSGNYLANIVSTLGQGQAKLAETLIEQYSSITACPTPHNFLYGPVTFYFGDYIQFTPKINELITADVIYYINLKGKSIEV